MATRSNYAYYPPNGMADYCISSAGGGRFGIYRELRTNTMPLDTPMRDIYDDFHREPTGLTASSREAAIDAMWALATAEGKAVPGCPEPPHRRRGRSR